MPPVPTVKIHNPDNPDDYIIINERDYVEGEHVLWGEWPADPPPG